MTNVNPTFDSQSANPTQLRNVDIRNKFYCHLIVYLLVNAGLMILNYSRNPDHLWFHWVALGWGIGIVCHAVRVFVFPASKV